MEVAIGLSLVLSVIAIIVTLRERASGPRTALYSKRVEVTVEMAQIITELVREVPAWAKELGDSPEADAPLSIRGQHIARLVEALGAQLGRSLAVLDEDAVRDVQAFSTRMAESVDDTKIDLYEPHRVAIKSLRRGIAADPLGRSIRYVTGQASDERDLSAKAGYRKMGERLSGFRPGRRE